MVRELDWWFKGQWFDSDESHFFFHLRMNNLLTSTNILIIKSAWRNGKYGVYFKYANFISTPGRQKSILHKYVTAAVYCPVLFITDAAG
jgi:hypothetical protein